MPEAPAAVNDSESNLRDDSELISHDLSESVLDGASSPEKKSAVADSFILHSQQASSLANASNSQQHSQDVIKMATKQANSESKVGKILSEST